MNPPEPPNRLPEAESRAETVVRATHKVKRGQTLSAIAEKYGISVKALRIANRMGPRDQVRSGQVLRIPSAS